MHSNIAPTLLTAFVVVSALSAQPAIEQRPLQFPGGANAASAKGSLRGDQTIDYLLPVEGGGKYRIVLQAGGSTYFNILPPGTPEALFIGSTSGRTFEGGFEKAGEYRIRVYQMRASARRGAVSDYTLQVRRVAGFVATEGEAGPAKYNAKGMTNCSAGGGGLGGQCEFRVVRQSGGKAEIWLQNPAQKGKFRVLYFSQGDFTTNDGGRVVTNRKGDEFIVTVNGNEHYRIVDAIITGG
jgi:hypothetical protein